MTVTTQASTVAPRDVASECPPWCGSHPLRASVDGPHELDLTQTWGATTRRYGEEKLSLTLSRIDDAGTPGEPRITVQYSPDGDAIDGFVDLPLSAARSLWSTMGWLITQAENEA